MTAFEARGQQSVHRAAREGMPLHGVSFYDATRYTVCVIGSFADRQTEKIWQGQVSRKLPQDIQPAARRKLRMLNNAASLEDLRVPPGNRLEALKTDRSGQFSIRVNEQWRICFSWRDGDAHDVEITDYH